MVTLKLFYIYLSDVTFAKDKMSPVKSFWLLTLYDESLFFCAKSNQALFCWNKSPRLKIQC